MTWYQGDIGILNLDCMFLTILITRLLCSSPLNYFAMWWQSSLDFYHFLDSSVLTSMKLAASHEKAVETHFLERKFLKFHFGYRVEQRCNGRQKLWVAKISCYFTPNQDFSGWRRIATDSLFSIIGRAIAAVCKNRTGATTTGSGKKWNGGKF